MGECKSCRYFIPDRASFCGHCGTYQGRIRSILENWLPPLGIIATIIVAGFIGCQSVLIGKQTKAIKDQTDIVVQKFTLEDRPYFYVVPSPSVQPQMTGGEKATLLAGVSVSYGNFGNYYAKDIEVTDIKLYDDKQGSAPYPVEEYWEKTYGGVQECNSVPPKSQFLVRDCRAGMGTFEANQKRYIQFSIRVKYKGIGKEDYKYGYDYIYIIDGWVGMNPNILVFSRKEYFDENGKGLPEIRYLLDEYKGK